MGLFGRNALPAPPSSREAFQAVPFGPRQRTCAGGNQTDLIERRLRPPVVAGVAGNDQVVEIGLSAAAVREHVVELHPQALEPGMLLRVPTAPGQYPRAFAVYGLSDFPAHERNTAEPAPEAVVLDQRPFLIPRGMAPWIPSAVVLSQFRGQSTHLPEAVGFALWDRLCRDVVHHTPVRAVLLPERN